MAYDTVKLRSPSLSPAVIEQAKNKSLRRSGVEMATGEERYVLFAGELLGSWDSRISVIPKDEHYVIGKNGRPVKERCEPYLEIEASVHKVFCGHNVYGGPTDFRQVCRDFVALVEELLETELPLADYWTVHRVDVALVYRLPKVACKEFFDGMQVMSFPRRHRGSAKYAMAVYFPGKTTTVKFYHKGTEFQVHERSRMRGFFNNLFMHLHGKNDPKNHARAERKLEALQRLADSRLRAEVEIHSDKFQYDFEKNPLVKDVTDAYLQQVYDKEVEKLLREGKQAMDTVRGSRAVLSRLKGIYGPSTGARLYGFWSSLCTLGDEVTREQFAKTVFYRNRKLLEDAGVSWRGTDVLVVANDGVLPVDFSPVRTDKRLCYLPARNRDGYQVSRETMRLAA